MASSRKGSPGHRRPQLPWPALSPASGPSHSTLAAALPLEAWMLWKRHLPHASADTPELLCLGQELVAELRVGNLDEARGAPSGCGGAHCTPCYRYFRSLAVMKRFLSMLVVEIALDDEVRRLCCSLVLCATAGEPASVMSSCSIRIASAPFCIASWTSCAARRLRAGVPGRRGARSQWQSAPAPVPYH
jgi:hypothetical protein